MGNEEKQEDAERSPDETAHLYAVDEEPAITITDSEGNKKIVGGSIGGFAVKRPQKTMTGSARINGLDSDWAGKKVFCILME